ncbi:hypothetical protein ACFQVA_38665 [Actinomadura keratinilytica]
MGRPHSRRRRHRGRRRPHAVHGHLRRPRLHPLRTGRRRHPHRRGALRRGPLTLHGSAPAVAAQALRRLGLAPDPAAPATGTLTVLLSGRAEPLPAAALSYEQGRLLAPSPPTADGPGRVPRTLRATCPGTRASVWSAV